MSNNIINVNNVNNVKRLLLCVAKTYKQISPMFHDHYTKVMKSTLLSECLFNKHAMEIDEHLFNTFIDNCIVYRLGLSDRCPQKRDIMYDLSNNATTDEIEVSLDVVLDQLLYSAVPRSLVNTFKQQLESQDVAEKIVEHVTFKLNEITKN